MINKVLVVGATGKVGREVVKDLLKENVNVIAASRHPENLNINDSRVTSAILDLENPTNFENLFTDVDALFLMAKPLDTHPLEHLTPLIDCAKNNNLKKIVMLSAIGVDQDTNSPLNGVERCVINSGIDYSILRPNFFMENFLPGFIGDSIKTTGTINLPAEEARTSFISVVDIGEIGTKVLLDETMHNTQFNLTGCESITYGEAARILTEDWGRDITYNAINDLDMRNALLETGWTPDM